MQRKTDCSMAELKLELRAALKEGGEEAEQERQAKVVRLVLFDE